MIFLYGAWYAGVCYLVNNFELLRQYTVFNGITKEMLESRRDDIMQRLNLTQEVPEGTRMNIFKNDFDHMFVVFNAASMVLVGKESYRKLRDDMRVAQDTLNEVVRLSEKTIIDKFNKRS